jgi:hypothetical protein
LSVAPLKLPWATATHVRSTAAALREPDWLLADRLTALETLAELPAEPNQLFMTYLDLRAVDFSAVEPFAPTVTAGLLDGATLPAGVAALIHVDERSQVTVTFSDAARAAGLIITTLAEAASERPALVREQIEVRHEKLVGLGGQLGQRLEGGQPVSQEPVGLP